MVRLAIGTRGWYDEAAATQSRGIATAALPRSGHAIAVFLGIVVVVVVVEVGTVVVVDVVDVDVVVEVVVATVVVDETVVVVVGGVDEAQELSTVVVVVGDNAGLSRAAVEVADVATSNALSAIDESAPRLNQWNVRRVTQ